jgi:amino acid adenylation domain-containing protein
VIHRSAKEHKLLVVLHHIITDEWGTGILHKEITMLYEDFSRGQAPSLPELPIQYADFACWQRDRLQGEVLEKQLAYWKNELAGAPQVLELTTDKTRPATQSFRGAWESFQLPSEVLDPLKSLGREERATLFTTLLAGFMALLYRYTGQEDILVGTPISLRRYSETENLIGYFLNTVVVRAQFSEGLSFRSLLQQVRKRALGAMAHAELPFNRLVAELAPERDLSWTPLFQVVFVLHDRDGVSEVSKVTGKGQLGTDSSKFDLGLFVSETKDGLDVSIEHSTDLFESATIRRIGKHFLTLLAAIGSNPDASVASLNLLTAAERRQVLYDWNNTKADYPSEKCVHELFEEQAARTPEAVAVVSEGISYSYGELNRRANQLAHYLRGLGVKPDNRVAICAERGFDLIVALLGVLKAGAAYLPLDPDYPIDRLSFMLRDSEAVAVLAQNRFLGRVLEVGPSLPVLSLDDPSPLWKGQPESNVDSGAVGLNSLHLAYVMYTSGSTGQPKGVMIPHRAINRLVLNNGYAKIEPGDRVAFAANPAFDASTVEVWAPLLNGGSIVVIDKAVLLDPARFGEVLRSQQISLLWLTVGLFNQYAETMAKDFAFVRTLMVGGDSLNVGAIARVLRSGRPQHLLNGYGPTETTTFATTYKIDAVRDDARSIPIGRPIANTQTYILDALRNPVPVGVPGELYIGGAGVARGYLNRPELTAERFLPDPFASEPEARMYRTGDLVRWLSDGDLEFLGRNDFQVKIRGFRIELGEIEARLAEHPAVREVVVLARKDTPGEQRLVAYYTASPNHEPKEGTVDAQQFRSHLSSSLPDYMIPAAFVRLESLPLTFNGKLDRKALPAPESDAYSTHTYEPPEGETEIQLAGIWAEILKFDRIGRHDNFFSLGGHSLMAVTLIERMRRAGFEVDARTFFLAPTLAKLAGAIEIEEIRI